MKNTKQVLALAMAVAMAAGLLAGCGSSASSSAESVASGEATSEAAATDTGSSDGTLVLADTGFEGKFSPFFAASSADQHVIDLTNIALLGADRKGEMILKGIEGETREYNGTDYTYYGPADCEVTENADGTVTYAINMRDDLVFADGTPITIDDVIFNLYVYMDPTYDGSATLYSMPIAGLDDYRSSMTTLSKLIAEAGEDNTDNSLFTLSSRRLSGMLLTKVALLLHRKSSTPAYLTATLKRATLPLLLPPGALTAWPLTLPLRISSWLSQKNMTGTLLPWKLRPQALLCLT